MIKDFIIIIIVILFHEMGHYFTAKRQGIYIGWGLVPNPHIKIKRKFKNRWNYLEGFAFSLFTIPLLIIFSDFSFFISLLLLFVLAILDFFVFTFYGKINKTKNEHTNIHK